MSAVGPEEEAGPVFDTHCTDRPICPYCGHERPDAWELDLGPGADFFVSRHVQISYTTRKVNREPLTSQDQPGEVAQHSGSEAGPRMAYSGCFDDSLPELST